MNMGPLAGLRVVELGTVVAGPFAASLLADLGADVVKVEPAGQGDLLRRVGPGRDGVNGWWGVSSRNKRCIGIDLKSPVGAGHMRRLLSGADLMISNYRPGALERLGFGPADLRALNPGLVHVAISGYGSPGPKSHLPGFGKIAEGMSGIVNLTGSPEDPPLFCGFSLGDASTGLFSALGAIFAVYARDRSGGTGAALDVALYDSLLRVTEAQFIDAAEMGRSPLRNGTNYPYGGGRDCEWPRIVTAQAGDGRWIAVLVPDEGSARAFLRAAGAEETDDTMPGQACTEHLRAWANTRSADAARDELARHGLEVAPVLDGASLAGDAYMRARGDVVTAEHEVLGSFMVPGHLDPEMAASAVPFHWAGLDDPATVDWHGARVDRSPVERTAKQRLFEDLVIVEISQTPGASFAATLFADYGATAFVLEQAGGEQGGRKADHPALWTALGRNKQRVVVDAAQGDQHVEDLLRQADLVVTDVPRRCWDDHPWLKRLDTMADAPAVVSVFPTGADRPDLWPWSTHPSLAAAASGLMAITGWEDGPPVQPEVPLADYCAGAVAALRAAAALWRGSARGLVMDEPMHRALARMIEWQCPAAAVLGYPMLRRGNSLALNMGVGSLCRSSDGKYISVSVVGDPIVERLLRGIGGDELLQDARFATTEARIANAQAAHQVMLDWALLHPADEIMQFAIEKDIVMGIVHDAEGIANDTQVQARANLVDVGAGESRVTLVAPTPFLAEWAQPMRLMQGEDTAAERRGSKEQAQ